MSESNALPTPLVAPGEPYDAPGVWYAGEHLASLPQSQTRPVSYCPQCLGMGVKP